VRARQRHPVSARAHLLHECLAVRRKGDDEVKTIIKWLVAMALLSGPVVTHAALIAVAAGLLVNDPDANLTWVSDANLMATQVDASGNAVAFVETIINDSGGTIISAQGVHTLSIDDFVTTNGLNTSRGQMTWYGAQAWVHYLNVTNYQGYSNWRLPRTVDNNSSIIGFGGGGSDNPATSSEMAHLFYGELGQVLQQSITTIHNGNYALFNNVQDFAYWSGTEYGPNPGAAWVFYANSGSQGNSNKPNFFFALAVRDGQVAPLAALLTEVTGVGPGRSLADKVALAQTYYAVPDIQATCAVLTGFINEVQAQAGKKISPQLDAKLVADAQAIEAAIGCK
jgi:Protein of unknown function (DUF1566)